MCKKVKSCTHPKNMRTWTKKSKYSYCNKCNKIVVNKIESVMTVKFKSRIGIKTSY